MRARLAVCLLFSVLIAGACGGRLVQSGTDDEGGSSSGASPGTAGSFSEAASPSTGATTGRGGRSGAGGTVALGGRFGTAGTSAGGAIPIAGTVSAGGGCACPGIACGSGSHLEVLPGQCCPTCVQDSCEAQLKGYQALRQQLLEKYSTLGCMTHSDCTVYYEKNDCAVSCGVPMPIAAIGNLDSNLQSYAQSSCSPSCMRPVPPCVPPAMPFCIRGLCQ